MSDPQDDAMSFDPRTWVEKPRDNAAVAPPPRKPAPEPGSRALAAAAAGAAILAAGGIAAYATREAPGAPVTVPAIEASDASH